MKKYLFVLVALSSNAFAYDYNCFSIDDNQPYGIEKFEMKTNRKTVVIQFAGYRYAEKYSVSDYTPKIPTDRAMMQLNVMSPHYDQYGEGPVTPFFADKALLDGGYELKKGGLGGFMKVTGWGYSWAKYLCVRK